MRLRLSMTILAAAASAAIAACASAPTTKVGWDQNVSFAAYHTWAWRPDGSIADPTWARRCQDVLSDQLQSDGLKQVAMDQNPDLWASCTPACRPRPWPSRIPPTGATPGAAGRPSRTTRRRSPSARSSSTSWT